ncbi:MAG: cation-translocating P-type ATPase [Bacillota bacterium]
MRKASKPVVINVHLLPGRMRLNVPGLQSNQAMAGVLAHRLSMIPGIKDGKVNPISGQLLILFDPGSLTASQLLRAIFGQHPCHARRRNLPEKEMTSYPPPRARSDSQFPWHALETGEVVSMLGTTPEVGLSRNCLADRYKKHGYNVIAGKPPVSFWRMFFEPLQGFMTKMLLVAAGGSLVLGQTSDALVIVVIVGLQALMEAVQQHRAEKSLSALKKLSAPTAKVIRDGKTAQIPARELVPGDIVFLEAGDRVPADCRLLEVSNLMTDESNLTGESVPVLKESIALNCTLCTADRLNMVYSGTNITVGRGKAVVVSTGMRTEMGQIAYMLREVETEPTGLQKQMEVLGHKITGLVLVSVGIIGGIGLMRGHSFMAMLRSGVSLAVGAIPEGLPTVVTISLAFGVQRMARRKAVVRKLSTVETLGNTTIICTDKTGTLTKNEMTVKEIYCNGNTYIVTGEGYAPEGDFLLYQQKVSTFNEIALKKTLKIGALCNNAVLMRWNKDHWKVQGDPTEGALLAAAAKADLWWEELKKHHCRDREIAFDSTRRMMTVLCRDANDNLRIYTKGAAEAVLSRCSGIMKNGTIVPLDLAERNRLLSVHSAMTSKALRVLAMAWKDLLPDEATDTEPAEKGLIFAGLMGMADPPRPGVREAIAHCHDAGIDVVMITGDHKNTAEAVARDLGITGGDTLTITGEELDNLSHNQLLAMASRIRVYSRTSPAQKLRIVRALKKLGHIVAMTGDGVNDAPAVKEADIGLAMGISGTDVTRGSAGITLSDDNFTTIVAGIEEGRTVADNISRSIGYVLSGNFGQVLSVFLAAVSGLETPLLPPQILWINLITEGLPAMALAVDPPRSDCMHRPPHAYEPGGISVQARNEVLWKGTLTGLSTFGLYALGLSAGWCRSKAQTMAFSHLVMSRVFNTFAGRRTNSNIRSRGEHNRFLLPVAGISTAMLMLTIYVPLLRPFFSTVTMGPADWGLIVLTSGLMGRLDYVARQLTKKH